MSAFGPSLGMILASGFLLFCLALSKSNISLHCEILKDVFLWAQALSSSVKEKKTTTQNRRGRKLAWFGKDLLVKMKGKGKKEKWKHKCVAWEEYRDAD